MKKHMAAFIGCAFVSASVCGATVTPQVVGFQSREDITHLAPGGANAARAIDVRVKLYDERGEPVRLAGHPVVVVAKDRLSRGQLNEVGRLSGLSDANGEFSGRMTLTPCRTDWELGPLRVHRISNRPEYWDITYASAQLSTDPKLGRFFSFNHICREVYRGYRP